MPKDWMDLSRYSEEYINGVNSFLDFAYSEGEPEGKQIQCPCKRCCNINWYRRGVVFDHLVADGFVKGYRTWINHGEWTIPMVVDDEIDDEEGDTYFVSLLSPFSAVVFRHLVPPLPPPFPPSLTAQKPSTIVVYSKPTAHFNYHCTMFPSLPPIMLALANTDEHFRIRREKEEDKELKYGYYNYISLLRFTLLINHTSSLFFSLQQIDHRAS
ncbi:hypothetical protein AHAS_Ahas05G0064700 [Arachis hypogaea]